MSNIFKCLKSPRVLWAGIGINCITFVLGFSLADRGLMLLSLMSAALCYIGIKLNKPSE